MLLVGFIHGVMNTDNMSIAGAAPPDEHCCRTKGSGARKSICFRMIRTLTQGTGAGGVTLIENHGRRCSIQCTL